MEHNDHELYVVICAFNHWEHYLIWRDFNNKSDHQPLKYLSSQKKLIDLHVGWQIHLFFST